MEDKMSFEIAFILCSGLAKLISIHITSLAYCVGGRNAVELPLALCKHSALFRTAAGVWSRKTLQLPLLI